MESTGLATRWTFYDPALLYLFPVTYVVHLTEEWFASAPLVEWTSRADRPFDPTCFFIANGIGLSLVLNGVYLVSRGSRSRWIVPTLATAVLLNSADHLVGSVRTASYSAGLITGVTLWIPLGLLTIIRVWDQARRHVLVTGVCVGAAVELIVVLVLPCLNA